MPLPHRSAPSRASVCAAAAAVLLTATACTGGSAAAPRSSTSSSASASATGVADVVTPPATTLVPGTAAEDLAAATSRTLFRSSRWAVVAAADDPAAQQTAVQRAERLGVPFLLAGPAAAEEVRRLDARVVAVGDGATAWAESAELETSDGDEEDDEGEDGGAGGRTAASGTVVLTTGDAAAAAASATATAAGARVQVVPGGDPRADGALVAALGQQPDSPVVAVGDAFGPQDRLTERLAAVRTGAQVPGGGQLPLAGRRIVMLYGHPGTPSLGVLGEQPVGQAVERAQQVASEYQGLGGLPAVPAMEIIATVASSSPGEDGDYSAEATIADLEPWVDAAQASGVAVVLDLQPGRASLLEQAKLYEPLLERPGVGLALDPEWKLREGQEPLDQIGSVDVEEVNETAAWLADLVRRDHLPQKVFMVHQFRLSMIRGRERLDTSHDELATVIHVDGNGTPDLKQTTYRAVTADAPAGVAWGWKNFYDEDSPTFTPEETAAVQPAPSIVSYQ